MVGEKHNIIIKQLSLSALKETEIEMVSRVEEAKKRVQKAKTKQQWQKEIECNKGKIGKFKRSSSNMEDDGASSAILSLACIALCTN
ncbi:hypothetical protein Fmac_001005 [Flemingia macrophylla]|uniref:Uncharacterized protein n=1 Tax=Flemingia macrophylla TaxID=520843 RepID=A0ABD1NFV7_9FABA